MRVERKCYKAHAEIAKAITAVSDSINRQIVCMEEHTAAVGRQVGTIDRQNQLLEKQTLCTDKMMTVITSYDKIMKIHTTTLQQCILMIIEKEENGREGNKVGK